MTTDQVWLSAAGAAALVVALGALLLSVAAQRRAARAEQLVEQLAQRLAALESPAAPAPRPTPDDEAEAFVITEVGAPRTHEAVPVAQDIDGRLFADIVARETVVKAASWTAGLRRALAPETRNRIRFAVRQETRRAGRERRSEMKQALREFRARERADLGPAVGEDVA
ncbi:hypothetical protein NOCD_14830 [Nocardioides cavernae]|uniref:hypothetical protein n=1 Tax=Nocardioides TaxID=1839 RepID=UPI0007031435|nr:MULTISPECIES: hypothetical protein [Nocardioides]MCK9824758.1 hypothetical protein [Nocardioides cavernae]